VAANADEIDAMLKSVAKDIQDAIGKAVARVQSDATMAGAFGGSRTYLNMNQQTADVFREGANVMATKARAYAGEGAQVAAAVDQVLTSVIEAVIGDRKAKSNTGRTSTMDTAQWADRLQAELVRLKDDAVRDLRHMPPSMPIGMTVTVSGNQGNINVAAGVGNTANQAVRGADVGEVAALIGQIKDAIANSQLSEDQRFDLQDHVEVLELEATKPVPDKGKLGRVGRRLLETAEKVGVATVGPATTAILKVFGL